MPRYKIDLKRDRVPPALAMHATVNLPQRSGRTAQVRIYSNVRTNDEGSSQQAIIDVHMGTIQRELIIDFDSNNGQINITRPGQNPEQIFMFQGNVYSGLIMGLLIQMDFATNLLRIKQDNNPNAWMTDNWGEAIETKPTPGVMVRYTADMYDASYMQGYVDINA